MKLRWRILFWAAGALDVWARSGVVAPLAEEAPEPLPPPGPGWVQVRDWVAVASTNLHGACLQAERCPVESGRSEVLRVVGYEAARVDPVRAVALSAGMEPGPDRDRLLIHAVREWAVRDMEAALNWVRQVEEDVVRWRLLGALAVVMADADPVRAAGLVAGEMGDGSEQARAAVGVLQHWAGRDPRAALGWLAQFPDSGLRRAAVRSMVPLWSERALDEVESWLAALPDPALRAEVGAAFRRLGARSTVVVGLEE